MGDTGNRFHWEMAAARRSACFSCRSEKPWQYLQFSRGLRASHPPKCVGLRDHYVVARSKRVGGVPPEGWAESPIPRAVVHGGAAGYRRHGGERAVQVRRPGAAGPP